jgi:hypothetical protein
LRHRPVEHMPRKKSKDPSIVTPKIEAAARATAEAKAIYSRKKTITEVVPPDVTRAKAGAWLDLISPLTEWAGLKGDELRHKREILRLQREDTLGEIAYRARRRLSKELGTLSRIPIKFIVPFLEQASLEEPESVLVDLWANLLVSASEGFDPHHIHFVGLISRLSSTQGEILKKLIGTESVSDLERAMKEIEWCLPAQNIGRAFGHEIAQSKVNDDDSLIEFIKRFFDCPGVQVVQAGFVNVLANKYYRVEFEHRQYDNHREVDYSILDGAGLIKTINTNLFVGEPFVDSRWNFTMSYYYLTSLGFEFAKACRIVA